MCVLRFHLIFRFIQQSFLKKIVLLSEISKSLNKAIQITNFRFIFTNEFSFIIGKEKRPKEEKNIRFFQQDQIYNWSSKK